MYKKCLVAGFISVLIGGCGSSNDAESPQVAIDFSESNNNFKAVFSDYYPSREAQNNEEFYQLAARHERLPSPYDTQSGWYLASMNRSDDIFMSIKGYSTGWEPETHYEVMLSVTIVSNVSSDCVGIGGAPGEALFMKIGASTEEPQNIILGENNSAMYRPNIDKGNQIQSGVNAKTVGDIANGIDCGLPVSYKEKTMSLSEPLDVKTDENGGFWLIAGTDSGFEGFTEYFIKSIKLQVDDTVQEFDFNEGALNFSPFFSDYPPSSDAVDNEKEFELVSSHKTLPVPFQDDQGWYLSGVNKSKDLFMGVTGYVKGLTANKTMQISIVSTVLSNTPSNCNNSDVADGKDVFIKHGATAFEPTNSVIEDSDFFIYELSIDKGKHGDAGDEAFVAGTLGTSGTCDDSSAWQEMEFDVGKSIEVTTDENGGFWLTVGADSISPHETSFYITNLKVQEKN
ncbi:hypothetical protein PN836_006440 [Ningiella sp. W23]|uniref:hypothetical protein n=1 Tax=Ningiella sp. W23 TaxID=3023715 RepID=UPI00375786DD